MAVLLEREAELERIIGGIGAAKGGDGDCLLIEGPAGIGKTALLEMAREEAAASGLTVLRARGAEIERAFAFGVARQLLERPLRERRADLAELFSGPARHAAGLLDIELAGQQGAPGQPFEALHGLAWLVANLAEREPVALLVDDAHWADVASLNFLVHLARRLEGLPVLLIAATRVEEPAAAIGPLRALAAERHGLLCPAPLSAAAADAIVAALTPDADAAARRSCHVASGGNPFLLNELARSLLDEDGRLDERRVSEHSPGAVNADVASRLGRLSAAAASVARAVAVLGGDAPLRNAAAVAGLDAATAGAAADELAEAGLLQRSRPLAFFHPLLRAAVYAEIPLSDRAAAHARAATLLAADGAAPERVAAQLLRCEPSGDPATARLLADAGRAALARGAPDAAVAYLRRAIDEPPAADERPRLLADLGAAELSAGELVAAIEHLRRATEMLPGAPARFEAAMLLAGALAHVHRAGEAVAVLEEQVDSLADHPELASAAEAALLQVARMAPATHAATRERVEAVRRRALAAEELPPAVYGVAARLLTRAGDPVDRGAALAIQAVDALDPSGATSPSAWGWFVAVRSLICADRFAPAREALDAALVGAGQVGAALDVAALRMMRAELLLRLGELSDAEVDARTSHTISGEASWLLGVTLSSTHLVGALTERGELDQAAHVVHGGPAERMPDDVNNSELLCARGRLRAAQARLEDAAEDLVVAGRRLDALDEANPAVSAWRSSLAVVLLALGERDRALPLAAEELARARAFGAPRAIGIALRACGLVEGGERGLALLREAVEVLADSQARLERARALVELGAAVRRSGQRAAAREHLSAGYELARRCGAAPLVARAGDELAAAGVRLRRPALTGRDSLTPSERRVADLAAIGMTNPEIAQTLYVTRKTVEKHLGGAYRKLDVAGRDQLAPALARG